MRSQQNRSFFSLIDSGSGRENYLSRSFQACFANSPSFRRVTLRTIWQACALAPPVPKGHDWECDYHPSTPLTGGGQPDLCLRPGNDGSFDKPIYLESKRESRLGESQLKKYKDHGTKILVAVTKYRPEISNKRLHQLGVNSLRWQDFCRALRQNEIT
jgi:hypothetical protein